MANNQKTKRAPDIALAISSPEIIRLCHQYHVRRLSIFGSALRNDFRPESDLDLLVEFEPGHTPGLSFFRLEHELSRILGRKVDLVTPNFLNPKILVKVQAEAQVEYEQARS